MEWHTRGKRKTRIGRVGKGNHSLPVNAGVWQAARKLALRCREAGFTLPTSDTVIAACAAHHKAELEHCDSHFDKILPLARINDSLAD